MNDQTRRRPGFEPDKAVRGVLQRYPHLKGGVRLERVGTIVFEDAQERPGKHQQTRIAARCQCARRALAHCLEMRTESAFEPRIALGRRSNAGHHSNPRVRVTQAVAPARQNVIASVSNRTGTSIEFALRGPGTGAGTTADGRVSSTQLLLPSGYLMNTKLALSAIVAALMLTACAKQESAGSDQAATPPAPSAPASDSSQSATPGTSADQSAPPAGTTGSGDASQPGAAAPATPPADSSTPPKQ